MALWRDPCAPSAGPTCAWNQALTVKRIQHTAEEWYLINATEESHTFHIHQMSYVQERGPNGIPVNDDLTFVPVGTLLPNPKDREYPLVKPSITRILIDFRHVPKGVFVYHCHDLFHEDHGMMGVIRVI